MVGSKMLQFANFRLQQIFKSCESFVGKSIIVLGRLQSIATGWRLDRLGQQYINFVLPISKTYPTVMQWARPQGWHRGRPLVPVVLSFIILYQFYFIRSYFLFIISNPYSIMTDSEKSITKLAIRAKNILCGIKK